MYGANGMASAMGQTEGFVKVAVDAATRRIAGCCAIGAGADAIVQEAAIAMAGDMTADTLRTRAVFAHPTLSELLLSARCPSENSPVYGLRWVSTMRISLNDTLLRSLP